ncbi:glycosyltransferase family A protein [Microterricola viridarii]|uniref:Glycosyl transferase family 2 n=1 Tax=Microterricola viridarii TaxID=412690 RepID=A0A1H1ZJC6_9MICO|nr:glycosyltransferase family A protein [Microterricola viridarii]SDT33729.1 Glycosyl transferase family 2 [Microterricola viridarii]
MNSEIRYPLIAIASYRRPDGLRALLRSLESASKGTNFSVVVVDNDPAGSACDVSQDTCLDLVYVVEPAPGIAAARNRALTLFGAPECTADSIVFVDDDEHVIQGWLDILTDHANSTGAAVVTGPVESVFPPHAPRWVVKGGFIQRPEWPNRAKLRAGATNNTLVKKESWRSAGSPRFDDSFSLTGGSDAKFFSVFLNSGLEIEYSQAARVFEPVPDERMTLKWLSRRAFRNGVVLGRLGKAKRGVLLTLGQGGYYVLTGTVRAAADALRGRGLQSSSFNKTINGVGVISSLFGFHVHEYRRKSGD